MIKTFVSCIFISLVLCLELSNTFGQEKPYCHHEKLRGKSYIKGEEYRGNQEIYPDWCKGKVVFPDGTESVQLLINLNGYTNELIYYNHHLQEPVVIDKKMVSSFYLEHLGQRHHFEKRYYENLLLSEYRFFEVVYSGKISMLVLKDVQLHTTSEYYNSAGELKNRKYMNTNKYFFVNESNQLYRIKLKKRNILKTITDSERQMAKRIIREKKLSFNTVEQMAISLKVLEMSGVSFYVRN